MTRFQMFHNSSTLPKTKAQISYLLYVFGQKARANRVDPDETPQNAASHQGLFCLALTQQILDTISGSKLYLFKR